MMEREAFLLHANDWVPNNERLPVLLYRSAILAEGKKAAERFERMFADHGWPPDWQGTIFDYHHYHSTTHEALGVFAGFATLMLGGPGGRRVDVAAGDALVLPVGTGHCRIEGSEDFEVVGAYPQGLAWDICCEAATPEVFDRMRNIRVSDRDPVTGEKPLFGN